MRRPQGATLHLATRTSDWKPQTTDSGVSRGRRLQACSLCRFRAVRNRSGARRRAGEAVIISLIRRLQIGYSKWVGAGKIVRGGSHPEAGGPAMRLSGIWRHSGCFAGGRSQALCRASLQTAQRGGSATLPLAVAATCLPEQPTVPHLARPGHPFKEAGRVGEAQCNPPDSWTPYLVRPARAPRPRRRETLIGFAPSPHRSRAKCCTWASPAAQTLRADHEWVPPLCWVPLLSEQCVPGGPNTPIRESPMRNAKRAVLPNEPISRQGHAIQNRPQPFQNHAVMLTVGDR